MHLQGASRCISNGHSKRSGSNYRVFASSTWKPQDNMLYVSSQTRASCGQRRQESSPPGEALPTPSMARMQPTRVRRIETVGNCKLKADGVLSLQMEARGTLYRAGYSTTALSANPTESPPQRTKEFDCLCSYNQSSVGACRRMQHAEVVVRLRPVIFG